MKYHLVTAAIVAAISPVSATTDASRLKGVGPEFESFYQVKDKFTCISNPSITISSSKVNDDYCDCPDGSDEPGTAACSYLSSLSPKTPGSAPGTANTTLALPGFYCANAGHNPAYVPFTHINDGVCDYDVCCDGSDEWASVGGVKCTNKCKEIGKEWRRLDGIKRTSRAAALVKKATLVTEAQKKRKEIEDWLQTAPAREASLEAQVKAAEKELRDLERSEKGRVVKGSGGPVSVLTGLAKEKIRQMTESLATVRNQRNEYQARANRLEFILSTFKRDYNPNFNDEGVKRAVKDYEDYAAEEKPTFGEANFEVDLNRLANGEDAIAWDDFEDQQQSDVDVLYKIEEYLPAPVRDWVDEKLRDLKVMLVDNGVLAAPKDGEKKESKRVTDARDRVSNVQRDLDNMRNEKKQHEEELSKDYGADDAFRTIKDQCIQKDAGEYTYEVCWLGQVTQISKKGGARNGMGRFERFEKMTVDEEVTPDGKGLGKGERVTMKYENGSHCWNGPQRSTTVVLACAENEEIWKVMEEEKCVYRVEAGTPAVCDAAAEEVAAGAFVGGGHARDEL